jgi:hypothetical protein
MQEVEQCMEQLPRRAEPAPAKAGDEGVNKLYFYPLSPTLSRRER